MSILKLADALPVSLPIVDGKVNPTVNDMMSVLYYIECPHMMAI